MENQHNDQQKDKARDTNDYQPIGGLYDDPRDHGSANSQRVDEGTQARDKAGNKREAKHDDNAAGSPTRSNSSEEFPGAGHGNG
jgi:hypothetical protein